MKKKVKVARTTKLPKPRERKPEGVTRRPLRILAPPDILGGEIAAIPLEAVVKKCVKTYEETTGAKANQTRLIDFVRWCEDNSGLL